ncbi:hypothetical protein BH09PSE2_BH09PSE2_20610 [soil metagenome]
MTALTTVRNLLAAFLACALLLFLAHAATPMLSANLPGQDALSAVFGLACLLIPIVYKLIDGAMGAIGFGKRAPPAYARGVSMIACGAVLALAWGVFAFVATHALAQMAEISKGAPAAESLIVKAQAHLFWLNLAFLCAVALFVGAWAGRRHGRPSTGVVLGIALFGWATLLTVDVLSGARQAADIHTAFRELISTATHAPTKLVGAAKAAHLPLLLDLFLAALVGGLLSGGGRSRGGSRGPRPLHLGGD